MKENQRIAFFDNAKFLLILLVVIGHFAEAVANTSDLAYSLKFFIYTFHIPAFILISGMFFHKEKAKKNALFFLFVFCFMVICSGVKAYALYGAVNISVTKISAPQWFMFASCVWTLLTFVIEKANRRFVLVLCIILSVLAGFDRSVGDFLCVSRILYFYPFYLLGTVVTKETWLRLTSDKRVRCAGVLLIGIVLYLAFFQRNLASVLMPMLSGRNGYAALKDHSSLGWLLRPAAYALQCLMTVAVLSLVPKKQLPVTKLGSRTIAVYSIHPVFIGVTDLFLPNRLYVRIITAVVLTFLLSAKPFYLPFGFLQKKIKQAGEPREGTDSTA